MAERIRFTNRKGEIYIEVKVGKKQGRYKYDPTIKIDVYKEYLKRRGTKRQISLLELKKGFEGAKVKPRTKRIVTKYRKKFKQIEPNIKSGIMQVKLKDVERYQRNDILKAKKNLLGQLVLDNGLLELLVTEENIKKIQHRLDYQIETKARDGSTITRTFKHGTTPENVIERIKKAKLKGTQEEYGTIRNKLSLQGLPNTKSLQEGTQVARTDLTITFRKR